MNWTVIDYYMSVHGFLDCDKYKIYDFVDTENRTRNGKFRIAGGYLTRNHLHLITEYCTEEEYSRIFLGIPDNFQ